MKTADRSAEVAEERTRLSPEPIAPQPTRVLSGHQAACELQYCMIFAKPRTAIMPVELR